MSRFVTAGESEGLGHRFTQSNVTAGGRFAGGPSTGSTGYGQFGKVIGFANSALESFPELFGIEPSTETQAFRAANPVSGFLSQMVGMGGAYGVAAKGLMMTRAAGIVNGAPRFFGVAERPIASMAAKWGTEAALLEGGRLAIAASPIPQSIFGEERTKSMGDLAGEAGLNIVMGAGVGAGVGAVFARAATGPRVFDLVPNAAPSQPLVQRARALREAIEDGGLKAEDGTLMRTFDEDQLRDLRFQYEQLKRANFADIEPSYTPTGHARIDPSEGAMKNWERGVKIVAPLENDVAPKSGRNYTDALNAWVKPGGEYAGRAELLVVDEKVGFKDQAQLDEFLGRTGLDKDDLALLGQNHRRLHIPEPTDPSKTEAARKAAAELEKLATGRRDGTIRSGGPLTRISDNTFIGREKDNGMWTVLTKTKGQVGKADIGDEWLFMRTDTPDILDPQAVKWRETTVNKSAYWPERDVPNVGVNTLDLANRFEAEFGIIQHVPKGIKPTTNVLARMGKQVGEELLAYMTPAVGIAARNNKANYALNLIKTLTDYEDSVVTGLLHGSRQLDSTRPAWRQFVTLDEPTGGGLADFYKTLDKSDWADVQNVLRAELPYEKMVELGQSGQITPKAYATLDTLEQISRGNVEEFSRLAEVVGAPQARTLLEDFNARAGHYGLSRFRDGGFYAMIDDLDTGELVGIAAGNTAKEARDKATQVIAQEARNGRQLTIGAFKHDLLRDEAGMNRYRAAVRKPGFLKNRGELLGDEITTGELDAEKFTGLVERNLRMRERYKTNAVLQEKLWFTMERLRNEDPVVANQIEKRLRILQGDEGDFARFQNRAVDRVLGNVLGVDSASAIVRNTQKLLNAFQFGFGNLAHYTLNATSALMTTFPEAAFLMRTAGQDLANYTTVPLVDGRGRIVDAVNVISDVKLFKNAIKRTFSTAADEPEWAELLNEMTAQGLIAPKYAEQHVGSTGTIVKDLKGAWQDGRSFLRWAGATNEIALAKSEEFNRLVGVATAYELSKVLKITDPFRRARFTREFMSKTAFNYTTVDRPTIFTTPMGSLMGTFKTWMFHYMVAMAKYAGGGRQTMAPLLWQTAATGLVGGTAALPLVKPMADAASKWFTDNTFMENLYAALGDDNEGIGDGIMYGLPGMLGLSLASQSSAPGNDPMRDASMIFNFAVFDRMRALGKTIGNGVEAYKATGVTPWEDDRTRDNLIRAVAPRTLYRAMSVSQDQAIRSLNTGYRVLDNVSLGDGLLYSMGFNPTDLDKAYEAYSHIRKSRDRQRKATSELGRQLAQAWEAGDNDAASRVFVSGMAQGLQTSSILRSAKARMERGEQTQLEFEIGEDKTGAAEGWGFAVE